MFYIDIDESCYICGPSICVSVRVCAVKHDDRTCSVVKLPCIIMRGTSAFQPHDVLVIVVSRSSASEGRRRIGFENHKQWETFELGDVRNTIEIIKDVLVQR